MRFGTFDVFAVEAQHSNTCGKWIYGQLRLWVNGVPFGSYDQTSDLAASARWGRTFLGASSRRTRPDLDEMPAIEAFELLYGRYVAPVNAPSRKPWAGPWDRDPYLLDEVGESAFRDKCAVVVVRRGDGADRVLVKAFDDSSVTETIVDSGVCDEAIGSYCAWVEGLRGNR